MSSQGTYTLKLLVDDSAVRKLEDKMNKMMNGGSISGAVGGASSSENPLKQLTKLGLIATGIGALVIMVKTIVEKLVGASPALQAMLQILDTSVTLILRPFGDFIAFLLKPILIMFLTKVALPFYKILDSPLIKAGNDLGNNISNLLFGDPNNPQTQINTREELAKERGIATTWEEAIDNLSSNLLGAVAIVTMGGSLIDDAFKNAYNSIFNAGKTAGEAVYNAGKATGEAVYNAGAWFGELVFNAGKSAGDFIFNAGVEFAKWIDSLNIPSLEEIWTGLQTWFESLNIPSLEEIWKGLQTWFESLNIPSLEEIWKGFVDWFGSLKIPQWVIDIVDGFFAFLKRIGDWLASIPDFLKNILGLNEFKSNGRGENTDPNAMKSAKLDININGAISGAGKFGDDVKTQVLGWFNEWLK